MTPEELLVDETRQWLERAREDLEAAALLEQNNLVHPALFHCQQAAEKSLKAFLTWNQQVFAKTHNLDELGQVCRRLDESLAEVLGTASSLTHFAWRFRYPGAPYEPDPGEVSASLEIAKKAHEEILKRLPEAAHP